MLFPYGNNIKLYIEGGSHDEKIEMLLKGFPAGLRVDEDFLSSFMARRAPGQNAWSTSRKEPDKPVFLSGLRDGITTGEDIHAVIYNQNQHSSDYSTAGRIPRPSHADYTAVMKYGKDTDLRGGGHYSGRLTSLICIAGALCMQYLKEKGIDIFAHIYSVGRISDIPFDAVNVGEAEKKLLAGQHFPVLDKARGEAMQEEINKARLDADSVGGIIECAAINLPTGLGEHMFRGVEGVIAAMVYSIPAIKGVEFGNGFQCASLHGSENNDAFYYDNGTVKTRTNNAGGILGGMTSGMPLIFRAAVKPTPSIGKEQDTVDLEEKKNVKHQIKGRHDPCIVPRCVPVTEAAAAIAILDLMLDEVQ
ncbi:MAG: chorismate synthase [Clostridia bacterium]|nr:chorismate synthase [Clostridia bacterium]